MGIVDELVWKFRAEPVTAMLMHQTDRVPVSRAALDHLFEETVAGLFHRDGCGDVG